MRAVRLTRVLTLETPAEAPDGAGGLVRSWQPLGEIWADMRAGSGREVSGQGASLSRARWRIIVRAAPQDAPSRPRPGQRFREGARLFDILAVAEADAAGRWLLCQAEEERIR